MQTVSTDVERPPAGGCAGFTLVELLIVISIIGILASISMAIYGQARVRGHEAATVAGLVTINQGQFAFAQSCGNQRYAPTLAGLAAPMPATGAGFISPDLGSDPVIKSGYTIELKSPAEPESLPSCNGQTTIAAYQVTAEPVTPGYSGVRYFGTNTDRVVYEDTATFAGNMPEAGAPAHGTETR